MTAFAALYGIRRLTGGDRSRSIVGLIKSCLHPNVLSLRNIYILSCMRTDIQSCSFPLRFPTKSLKFCMYFSSFPCPVSLILPYLKPVQIPITQQCYHLTYRKRNKFQQHNNINYLTYIKHGVRGGAVGWGTALQTGRSRVRLPLESLEFFSDLLLPVALWLWGRLSL